jgi:CRISPR-associated endonuclease Csn1
MVWRLALDMGTNSLGWTAFSLNNSGDVVELMDAGVRIFSDGREPSSKNRVGESLAVQRRLARGARRNRDRRLRRKQELLYRLVELGLMPKEASERKALEILNPYQLRADALERPLTAQELGRVLFQINQRRGFLSNRKSDGDDEETGKIKPKITELRHALGGQTLGQWLNDRLKNGKSIRFRGDDGDYYADRAMYLFEFDQIRSHQTPHHMLSEQNWDDLRNGNKAQGFDGIFFQRKLKPVEKGRCEFFINEYRAHKDLPISHEFRILQEIANLQYYDKDHEKFDLDDEQRKQAFDALDTHKTLSFGSIRKLKRPDGGLLFPKGCLFNLETGPRDKLNGNATAIDMRKPEMFGEGWNDLSPDDQNDVVEMLHDAEDDAQLIANLQSRFGLNDDQAKAVSKFKMTSATTNLSRKFMMRCADIMREKCLRYDEAVTEVWDDDGIYQHHSHRVLDELLDRLPYYGEVLRGSVIGGKPADYDPQDYPEQHYGKINNPTVHVALNQLRKLVNRLMERFGPPAEIHVELVRDLKKTAKARNDIAKENATYAKANDKRAEVFRELMGGQKPTGLDLKKMRLWEELGKDQISRLCPFSGKPISAAMLFNGEAEIEHILPFSRTLDNSAANLTVAIRQANRLKGNNTPYEAFAQDHHADNGMVWADIASRASSFPKNKRWRFDSDAMNKFNKEGGFIARQLTDNAYISRVTKRYLSNVCDQNKIVAIPGGLTAMMRGKWYLNSLLGDHNFKERNDHRHHIIDAFVVGLTDRSTLNSVSHQTARSTDDRVHIELPDITPLRNQLSDKMQSIVVSYKPDHGTNGKMFNETAYGIVQEDKQDPDLKGYNLITRKKISALSEKEINAIRNRGWRTLVQAHVAKAKAEGTKLDANGLANALSEFGQTHNIKTIRLLVSNQSATVIPSAPYKAYAPDSFVCVDIWQVPKGKSGKWVKGEHKWEGAFWSYALCKRVMPDKNKGLIKGLPIHPAAKFITRLFKNDLVELQDGKQTVIMKVGGFSTTNNKIDLRPQYETDGARKYVSINSLQISFLRRIKVFEDGTVKK